jgi:hypothetical protein
MSIISKVAISNADNGRSVVRDFEEWLSELGGLTDGVRSAGAFCPKFESKWNSFRNEFSSFLTSTFQGTSGTKSLFELLSEFHKEKPGFRLAGCVIEGDLFRKILRFARDSDMRYLNQRLWQDNAMTIEKLRSFSDAKFARYFNTWAADGLELGGASRIVWAMGMDEARSLVAEYPNDFSADEAAEAIKLLGLVDMLNVTRIIAFAYNGNTNSEPIPRTPTPIDGLGNVLFHPSQPCDGLGGWTRTATGKQGIREAVHGKVVITINEWVAANIRS